MVVSSQGYHVAQLTQATTQSCVIAEQATMAPRYIHHFLQSAYQIKLTNQIQSISRSNGFLSARTSISPCSDQYRRRFTHHHVETRSYLPKPTCHAPLAARPRAPLLASRPALSVPQTKNQPQHQQRTMSSDADYAAFLDKANKQSEAGATASASAKKSAGTKSVDTAVPQALEHVDAYYTSDADEPFEPVALKFDAGGKGELGVGMLPCSCSSFWGMWFGMEWFALVWLNVGLSSCVFRSFLVPAPSTFIPSVVVAG